MKKLRVHHRAGVPHYWLADPTEETLVVMRWSEPGYVTVLAARRGETARAEPFDAIEIEVGTLFGDDPRRRDPRPTRAAPSTTLRRCARSSA